ncbi:hypothetical protein GON03_19255 [Nocardioides sp. MAH-18]|uniref:Uncharacterized protein n=1 Tax=Nocardioides agri TaxID=2682843 RepID=A0A6L6XXB4_9ACTN|nr:MULTISPECIES: hypothetical protein [unclassified Nocardioides]MBA2952157.1 hypothetical protein [Nocardioides sp. CGMCC 1.13656]MVQ51323.1 hypothetical protein [Nocardioides sp. MAH-18]
MTETSTTSRNTAAATADRLKVVADLLAAHPDLPAPCVFAYSGSGHVEVTWQLMNTDGHKDNQRDAARTIIAALGGKWTKNPWDDRFDFARPLDGGITLQIFAHRDQLCERIVTGSETVTIPAVEAQPERTEQREVVEWRCHPLLADEAVSA